MRIRLTVLVLSILLLSSTARAHHSFAAEFQADKTLTIVGVVTEVWFRNPHVRYYLDVETDDGATEAWDIRGSSPTILVRRGWNEDTIKVGDRIRVEGFVGHDGRKLLSIISIELPNGDVIGQSY